MYNETLGYFLKRSFSNEFHFMYLMKEDPKALHSMFCSRQQDRIVYIFYSYIPYSRTMDMLKRANVKRLYIRVWCRLPFPACFVETWLQADSFAFKQPYIG
jgi:hypothetical protein